MFQLDRHIEILLLDNDCVIVPGLGGFIAHHVSAHYDEETNTFIPPLRTLGFNRQLQINDSLLAQSYIETYDISYPEAIRRIESEVNELVQELRAEGEYELHGLGKLHLDEYGKMIFEPYEAGILTPQLYGLNIIDINPLISTKSKTSQKSQILNLTPQSYNIEQEEEAEENSGRTITIRVSTIKYAVASVAAVIFLVVFALPFGLGDKSGIIESTIDTSFFNNLLGTRKDNTTREVKSPKLQKVITAKTDTLVAEPQVAEVTVQKDTIQKVEKPVETFSIVLASRVSRYNATEFVKKLKRQGVKARIITRKKGCLVVTGNYNSKKEALDALRTYRSDYNVFEESWITLI